MSPNVLTKLITGFVVKQCNSSWTYLTESSPDPAWQEYLNLSYSDLRWTAHTTQTVEVTLFFEIARLGWPIARLGKVHFTNSVDGGLLDLSTSSWCRMCRYLEPKPNESDVSPVLDFDVIMWPPEQTRPVRSSTFETALASGAEVHPHQSTLEQLLLGGGLSLVDVADRYMKLMEGNIVPLDKWSIRVPDGTFSGAFSTSCARTDGSTLQINSLWFRVWRLYRDRKSWPLFWR